MITLDDVAGLEYQKKVFYNELVLPIKKKQLLDKLILQPDKVLEPKTFLLYGPPGTGKTYMAKA